MFEELIKAELKKRGLAETLWTLIKVDKQEDIAAAVGAFASEVDRRVKGAVDERDTKIKDLEAKIEESTKKPDPKPGDGKTGEDPGKKGGDPDLATTIQNAVAEAMKGLKQEFENTYGKPLGELTTRTKQDMARKALQDAKLDPEKFLRFVDLEKIDDSVKAVSELFAGEQQKAVNDALTAAGRPPVGAGGTSDAFIEAYAASKNSGGVGGALPAKEIPGITTAKT